MFLFDSVPSFLTRNIQHCFEGVHWIIMPIGAVLFTFTVLVLPSMNIAFAVQANKGAQMNLVTAGWAESATDEFKKENYLFGGIAALTVRDPHRNDTAVMC